MLNFTLTIMYPPDQPSLSLTEIIGKVQQTYTLSFAGFFSIQQKTDIEVASRYGQN